MFYWIRSFTIAVFFCAGYCRSKDYDQNINGNTLHQSMTTEELRRYFGDTPVNEEYEVTHPFQSNEKGEFMSYELSHQNFRRRRRDTGQANVIYYQMKAFGINLHLNVTLNENLLGPKFVIETRHKNGTTTTTTPEPAGHLIGNVISHKGSTVAISNREGLEGMIQLMSETFFVQPLPTRLAKRYRRSVSSVPHVIVRKSAKGKTSTCEQEEVINRRRRSTTVNQENPVPHKYLQTAYVVDQYAAEFFGESTLPGFLPTMANIVAGIFRDDSFGEIKVNYILNKIIILNNNEMSYAANASSRTKLYHIGNWARENNPESENDPEHFDTVTLLSLGAVGGRGTLGTLCNRLTTTSNVVHMAGMNSASIIAHEIFHNFGYNHDHTTECPNYHYIMSTTVSPGPASFTWSNCSRKFAQRFLSSGASECLNDPPSPTIQRPTESVDLTKKLPGTVFDADRQCELQYGNASKKCPTTQDQCDSVYCTTNYRICHTSFVPPLDGTRCGVRHWCIEGVCVDDGSPMIDGDWGEWSDYGSCTRTCGGGVQSQTRECNNPSPQNGGAKCEGSIRGNYRICNRQTCPDGTPSFRQLQCSAKGDYTEHIMSGEPCSLVCRSGSNAYWLGGVKDGTRCFNDPNNLDVCVERQCKEVGCDYNLESGKTFDRCRVCGGDGSSCGLNIVNYTKAYYGYGYSRANTMVTLPVNSTNVVAIKKGVTYNNIGVQSMEGEYIINLPTWSKSVEAAGTTISYIHERNQYRDRIYINGPTNQEIKLVFVYLYERNKGVDISYYGPVQKKQETNFQWKAVSSWSDCSQSCAGGMKTRLLQCVRGDDKTEVGFRNCNQSIKPESMESCNIQACPPEWYVSLWQTCSLPCGKGSQQRSISCRQKVSENEWETLNETKCTEPKPDVSPLVRVCNEIDCRPEYVGQEWSQCSTTCSPGVMTRTLQCKRRTGSGTTEVLPYHWCEDYGSIKSPTTTNCNLDSPCEPPPHQEIGCFKLDTEIFPTILANFQDTLDYENVLVTARSCAQLALDKDYNYFGLANNGECRTGPNLESTFFQPPTTDQCSSFVGKTNAIFVYTLTQIPNVSPVGCYADSRSGRAMPVLVKNFRNQINWYKMERTVNQCAHVAYYSGYQYFGVQFYGECWSGENASTTYNKHGNSTKCWEGVGQHWANFVYKFD